MINRINALAKRIPRDAFKAAGALDCVTYVIVLDDVVLYVGEGYPHRSTDRGKKQGLNHPDLDYIIEQHYDDPSLKFYCAASNITKAVALEFEGILMDELKPLFNIRPKASIWRRQPIGKDTFSAMKSAKKIDVQFAEPPRSTHNSLWNQHRITNPTTGRLIDW
jgi:hypothetical protein